MKAVLFQSKEKMEVVEMERPHPGKKEVLVRMKVCGICGTDQHIYHGHPGSAEVIPPMILGHECSGLVEEVGEGVRNLKAGERVTIDPNIYCGECEYCRRGEPHLCENLEAIGVTRNGGMAEFTVVPAANCFPLPDEISDEEGALIEPLGCVLHGLKKINLFPGMSVLIVGGGFIGQLFLQLLKRWGASLAVVSEPVVEKHPLLRSLGADRVVAPGDLPADEIFDVVIECVGRKESMEEAFRRGKKGGQILLFGVSDPHQMISVNPYQIFSKELKISGSFINPHTHMEAISLVQQGAVRLNSLISHRFRLEEVPTIMAQYPSLKVAKGIIRIDHQ